MKHPKDIFAEMLFSAATKTYKTLTLEDISNSVDYCDPNFGEFSSNIAFKLSRMESKKPVEVGSEITSELKSHKHIKSADFLEPGFINVVLTDELWQDYLSKIDKKYAHSKEGGGKKVQVEFISANPTGPLVLTNAWQGYYGDILTNVFGSQGYVASREYYLNDGGNQVTALGMAIQQVFGKKFAKDITENLYRGEYIDEIAKKIADEVGGKSKLLAEEPLTLGKRAAELIVEIYIKADLVRLGVKFDSMYSETKPDIKKVLDRLESAGLVKQKDGATWLDGSKVGLKQDEVLVRSYDNEHTYFLKDLAYQLERLEERGFDQTITIVGPDHHGQAIRLTNTLKVLGHDAFQEISTQTIRLIKDGQEFKISKRKGNYILLDEFLKLVPTEAARFYFAMRDTNTHMDFDIDLVRERSAKNPVYYSLYAYARACSIERKANEQKITAAQELNHYSLSKEERRLVVELSKIPGILSEIVNNHRVNQLLHQTFEIAKSFHEYYEADRVLNSLNVKEKLKIIAHFKQAYESIFAIIGVDLLYSM